jgi:hypothetical protein
MESEKRDVTIANAFADEMNKISMCGADHGKDMKKKTTPTEKTAASAIAEKIQKAKAAGPGPDTGKPGKGKNDSRFIENIGKGFNKGAAAKPGESKVSQLLASMKKEPKGKA